MAAAVQSVSMVSAPTAAARLTDMVTVGSRGEGIDTRDCDPAADRDNDTITPCTSEYFMLTKSHNLRDAILWVIAPLKIASPLEVVGAFDSVCYRVGVQETYDGIDQLCRDGLLRKIGRVKLTDQIMLAVLEASMSNDLNKHAKVINTKLATYSLTPRGWRTLHVSMLTHLMRPKHPQDRPRITRLVQAIEDGTEDLINNPVDKKQTASTKKKARTSTRRQ